MDPFVGEIRLWALNFAPLNWAFCQGQLLPISRNTALFSLLGTNFGGDGKSTFGLPNLQGQATVGMGQGTGLSQYFLGEAGGSASVTLLTPQMPSHTHMLPTGQEAVAQQAPSSTSYLSPVPGGRGKQGALLYANQAQYQLNPVVMNVQQAALAGGSQPHNNMAPYLTLNYCICLAGVFPTRQ